MIANHQDRLSVALECISSCSQALPWVSSARFGGSIARGEFDRYSDFDIYLVVDDPYQHNWSPLLREFERHFHSSLEIYGPATWVDDSTVKGRSFSRHIGDVAVHISSVSSLKISHMQSNTVVPEFDRSGLVTDRIRREGSSPVPLRSLRTDWLATAWFQSFQLCSKYLRAPVGELSLLQTKEALALLESIAALDWLSSNVAPPGLDYRNPFRGFEAALPREAEVAAKSFDMVAARHPAVIGKLSQSVVSRSLQLLEDGLVDERQITLDSSEVLRSVAEEVQTMV